MALNLFADLKEGGFDLLARGVRPTPAMPWICLIVLLSGEQRNTETHGAMFAAGDALQEFEAFLSRRGLAVASLDVAGGSAAMLDFYRDHRPAGCAQIPDGDMLLFQWGTYDWGEGEHFQLDLTRQFILSHDAEDEDIWQLSLTFLFDPASDLRALGVGNAWCDSVQALPKFQVDVSGSAAFAACNARPLLRAMLRYECAG